MPKLYSKWMIFKEGEQDAFNKLWEEELRECIVDGGLRLDFVPIIARATK